MNGQAQSKSPVGAESEGGLPSFRDEPGDLFPGDPGGKAGEEYGFEGGYI